MKTRHYLKFLGFAMTLTLMGCHRPVPATAPSAMDQGTNQPRTKLVFALVAKSQSNPVFESARVGAEDAAKEIGNKLGMDIEIVWRTPDEEDAQKQVEYIDQLALQGVDGISVSCTEAETLTLAINRAVDSGIPVMCFDSDAPASQRFCYYATDDDACGHTIMRELAKVLGPGHHVVAIPGGDQNSLNLQNRVKGALAEATNCPNISV